MLLLFSLVMLSLGLLSTNPLSLSDSAIYYFSLISKLVALSRLSSLSLFFTDSSLFKLSNPFYFCLFITSKHKISHCFDQYFVNNKTRN